MFDSSFKKPLEYGPDLLDGIYKPTFNVELIKSLSITMVAYSYQQNLFPIFEELQNKTPEMYHKVAMSGLSLTALLYFSVALISIFMFGDCLESSVLLNIGGE